MGGLFGKVKELFDGNSPFVRDTISILTKYLEETGRIARKVCHVATNPVLCQVVRALVEGEDILKEKVDPLVQKVPSNASVESILNMIKEIYYKGGEIKWLNIIESIVFFGLIINGLYTEAILKLIVMFAKLLARSAQSWINHNGGWPAIIDYIANLSTTEKVVAFGGMAIVSIAAGAVLFFMFGVVKFW